MRTALSAAHGLLLLLAACGSVAESDVAMERDSAGILIIESRAPADPTSSSIRVDMQPALRIGSLDDADQQLYRVTDAIRLPDGRLVIANAGSSELRIHGASGDLVRTVGRPGDGPGEFRHPTWLELLRDTLVVYDAFADNGRLSWFTPSGEFIRSERLVVPGLNFPNPKRFLPDGSLLDEQGEGSIGPSEVGHVRYTRIPIRYVPGAGVDTIARVAGTETFREQSGPGIAQWPVPYSPVAGTAVTAERIWFGNGSGFVIDGYTPAGVHEVSIRAPARDIAVTSELRSRWVDAELSTSWAQSQPDRIPLLRRRYEATPAPDRVPEYHALLSDAEGRIWAQLFALPGEAANDWRVFDADGRWLHDVAMPTGVAPFEIGADYVLGLRTDDLDVEYVEVYRLRVGR